MSGPIVLKLVRESARKWWWFQQLRKQGRIAEAQKLERDSIRSTIKTMRTCKVESWNFSSGYLAFYKPEKPSKWGDTVSISNVAMGEMAAWIYVIAHRLGAQK